jgi:hypothetical protein
MYMKQTKECLMCKWKGDANGYRQHILTEKHTLNTELQSLKNELELTKQKLEAIRLIVCSEGVL